MMSFDSEHLRGRGNKKDIPSRGPLDSWKHPEMKGVDLYFLENWWGRVQELVKHRPVIS